MLKNREMCEESENKFGLKKFLSFDFYFVTTFI